MAPAVALREAAATAAATGSHMAAAASASGVGHVTKENLRWTGSRLSSFRVPGLFLGWHCSTSLAIWELCTSGEKGEAWYSPTGLSVLSVGPFPGTYPGSGSLCPAAQGLEFWLETAAFCCDGLDWNGGMAFGQEL